MNCPNCDKLMEDKSRFVEEFFCTGDDPDYYPTRWYEEHRCKACGIKYKDGEWFIPAKYQRPTDKQLRCVSFINRQLGTNYEPALKKSAWRFIKDNLPAAQKIHENAFSQWCEENSDWLPEYY